MSNISKLTSAGLIAAGASFSDADQALLESLSDDEVNALISIKQKLPAEFLQRNCSGGPQAAAGGPALGIVF